MIRFAEQLINSFLDLFWSVRPSHGADGKHDPRDLSKSDSPPVGDLTLLLSLVRRFPYWKRGRLLLAEGSLAANDIATAYAEGQALKTLTTRGSRLHTQALVLLGQSFLRRGDGRTALLFLNEASECAPDNAHILEERAAALCLEGEKATALSLLRRIPENKISAEGKAAMAWLSAGETPSFKP